ncbi:hypothetical protein STRIP9103_03853, partial [Streptomyces ipomoeae 91-03]
MPGHHGGALGRSGRSARDGRRHTLLGDSGFSEPGSGAVGG